MSERILSGGLGHGKRHFTNLCIFWINSVRAGEEYENYKKIELEIISKCDGFGLDPDEVMVNLQSFAKSGEEIIWGGI